jgi:hypothetical protein
MPEQAAGQPAAQREAAGKGEREQRRGIVNLPAGADQDQNRQRIDPMGDAYVERMNDGFSRRLGVRAARVDGVCIASERHG